MRPRQQNVCIPRKNTAAGNSSPQNHRGDPDLAPPQSLFHSFDFEWKNTLRSAGSPQPWPRRPCNSSSRAVGFRQQSINLRLCFSFQRLGSTTTCGFIGLSGPGGAFFHELPQSFMPACASCRKRRSVFLAFSSGISSRKVLRLSPTRPTSTGKRRPILLGSSSICTPRACFRLGQEFDVGERSSHH